MAMSPLKDSFVVPDMEDTGVWSSDEGGSSNTSADLQGKDNTPPEDAAAAKDENFTWPFKKFSELAKSAKGKVTKGMVEFIQKQ